MAGEAPPEGENAKDRTKPGGRNNKRQGESAVPPERDGAAGVGIRRKSALLCPCL